MRRLAFAAVLIVSAYLWHLWHPNTDIRNLTILALAVLVYSLVKNPVTKFIAVDKWHEIKNPGWKPSVNKVRNVDGIIFQLKGGSVITGKLVMRSDSMGVLGVRCGTQDESNTVVFQQVQLERIEIPENLQGLSRFDKERIEAITTAWEEASPPA